METVIKTPIEIRSETLQHCEKLDSNRATARAIWQNGVAVNMSRPQALDRAAIDANDQSDPSVRIR